MNGRWRVERLPRRGGDWWASHAGCGAACAFLWPDSCRTLSFPDWRKAFDYADRMARRQA